MTKKHCDPPPAATGAGSRNTTELKGNSSETVQAIKPRLLDSGPAAAYLCIGKRKLWQLTNCGEIACIRIGRSVRYDIVDLDAFITRHRKGGPRK